MRFSPPICFHCEIPAKRFISQTDFAGLATKNSFARVRFVLPCREVSAEREALMVNTRSFPQAAGASRGPCVPRTAQAFAAPSQRGIAAATRPCPIERPAPWPSAIPLKLTLSHDSLAKAATCLLRMAQASADDRMKDFRERIDVTQPMPRRSRWKIHSTATGGGAAPKLPALSRKTVL